MNLSFCCSCAFLAIRISLSSVFVSIGCVWHKDSLILASFRQSLQGPDSRQNDVALPTLPFTTNCSDFHVPFIPLLLFLQLVWNYPVTLCLIYTSSQFIPGTKRGSPKFLIYPFTILPWPQTPLTLVSTKTVLYLVLMIAVFPHMKKVDRKIHILFQGSIPSLALRPGKSFPLAPQ